MKEFENRVIIGDIILFPKIIREFLVKSHYFLTYDPGTENLKLNVNHGSGGQVLFEIRRISYESVTKLAKDLGLKGESEAPLIWEKWNPILCLHHDGSKEAEMLRVEMLKLGVPHTVHQCEVFGLTDGQCLYESPMWSVKKILQIIRKVAKRYKESLTTKP